MTTTFKRVLETRSMPTLLEQRNNLMTEMETLISTAKTETRALTDEEGTNFNRIKSEIQKIDKTIQAEQDATQLSTGETRVIKKPEEEEQRALAEDKFLRFIRGEERALDVAGNGAVIPTEISNRIIDKVYELSPIYARSTKFNVGGDLVFPKFDPLSITTAYVADMTALTPQNGNFTTLKLQNFIAGSLVQISRSLMNRTDFDLVSHIVMCMAQSIANFVERELLVGAGGTSATGLFRDTNVTSVTTGGGTVALDDIISAQLSIPQQFQNEAVWIMAKPLFATLRKLKDADGRPLLNPDIRGAYGWEMFGKPVFISHNAPIADATGEPALAYGDLSGMYVKLAQNVEIQILNELYATSHSTGCVGYIEFDSRVVEEQKLAVLKLA